MKIDIIAELTKGNVFVSAKLKRANEFFDTDPFLGGVARSQYESVQVVASSEVPSNAIAS